MARGRARSRGDAEQVAGVTGLEQIASGGFSTVHRAWQPAMQRWVAVKVLHVTLADAKARERFGRELAAQGRLTGHPHIATVLASGVASSGRPYLTMDLYEGGSLADGVLRAGPLTAEEALRIGVKLAGALAHAHAHGILHRDIKPENVLVSRYGEPALADFGIAAAGEARGATQAFTATHAAPEVLEGGDATTAADVYGLGSTLWAALAGRPPFPEIDGEGPLRHMLRVIQEPVPPLPAVHPAVEAALCCALAKDPKARPASALEFGQRLQRVQAELGFSATELVGDGAVGVVSEPALVVPGPVGGGAMTTLHPGRADPGRAPVAPPPDPLARPPRRPVPNVAIVAMTLAAFCAVVGAVWAVGFRDGGGRGASVPPPTAPVTTASPPSTVAGPTGVLVHPARERGTVVVRWTAPPGSAVVVGYVVVHAAEATPDQIDQHPVPDAALEATVAGLPAGRRCFVVQAVYARGPGGASGVACATVG